MKASVYWGGIVLAAGVALGGCFGRGNTPVGRIVRVAAAADLQFAFDELARAFQTAHPGIGVRVSYGSSGTFYAQLANDAPFDLYLSADIDYPRRLIKQGKAVAESEFLYAVGQIVVWVPERSDLDVPRRGINALLDPQVKKIAIANPQHAPYGRAAQAAMRHFGIYAQLQDRLVFGENIAQTAQFVESGAADVGVIALSLALAPAFRQRGRYAVVPLEAYPRIEQGGVILNWSQDRSAAELLRAFIIGTQGRAILAQYGFLLPQEAEALAR